MVTFSVNIFGTSNDDVDSGGATNGTIREFILHVMQIESNTIISDFNMFIEFYAVPWDLVPSAARVRTINGVTPPPNYERVLNGRKQVIHLNSMSPTSAPALISDCLTFPSGGGSCPNPEDIRLYSMVHGVPIDTGSGTGYDIAETDMYDDSITIAKLPVDIIIIADGCRYNSSSAEVNIYKDYFSGGGLYGGSGDINIIGSDEKIIIA